MIRAFRSGRYRAIGAMLDPADALRRALSHAPSGTLRLPSFVDGTDTIVGYQTLKDYALAVSVGFATRDYLAAWRMRSASLLVAAVLLTVLILAADRRSTRLLGNLAASVAREWGTRCRETAKAQQLESLFQAVPDAA